jgi:hypothetical protein
VLGGGVFTYLNFVAEGILSERDRMVVFHSLVRDLPW